MKRTATLPHAVEDDGSDGGFPNSCRNGFPAHSEYWNGGTQDHRVTSDRSMPRGRTVNSESGKLSKGVST